MVEWLCRRLRKHDYDLSSPMVVKTDLLLNGKPFSYNVFRCQKCGQTLALDLHHMRDLPPQMARGCPGKPDAP